MNTYIPAREKNIRICGRTKVGEPLPLFWTASGVEFVTDSTECYMDFTSYYDFAEQWIRVEIDGFEVVKQPVSQGMSSICVFKGLGNTSKTVRLFKEVQPMRNDERAILLLDEIRMDGQLLELPERKLTIEIVGDSITSGEGLGGPRSLHSFVPMIFSTRNHYGVELEKRLSANVRLVSQSGWGVYCSWDNAPSRSLPPYYEKTCGVPISDNVAPYGAYEEYDFSAQPADVVIINLGTNDQYAFDSPAHTDNDGNVYKLTRDENGNYDAECLDLIMDAVYNFLVKVRKYNPLAKIVWAYGMIDSPLEAYIKRACDKYIEETGDTDAEYFPLINMKDEWIGANNHPGGQAHVANAEALEKEIKRLIEK